METLLNYMSGELPNEMLLLVYGFFSFCFCDNYVATVSSE